MNHTRKIKLYRWGMGLVVIFGAVALIALRELGRPMLGVGVYWLSSFAFLAIWKGTSITLFDEREDAISRRASDATIQVLALVVILAGVPSWMIESFESIPIFGLYGRIEPMTYAILLWFPFYLWYRYKL